MRRKNKLNRNLASYIRNLLLYTPFISQKDDSLLFDLLHCLARASVLHGRNSSKNTSMHPVLKSALEPLAQRMAAVSQEEAQIPPQPGQGRWSAQEIIEHLILTYRLTSESVGRHLKSGRVPHNRRNLLEFFVRMQTIGLGMMPDGIPAIRAFRPTHYRPEEGPAIAARFLDEAEEMDKLLVAARKKFGIQACGEHPFFGVMRVDEWRRYHAVHAGHHRPQLDAAIRYAKSQKTAAEPAVDLTPRLSSAERAAGR
jgi:hypothetical protein